MDPNGSRVVEFEASVGGHGMGRPSGVSGGEENRRQTAKQLSRIEWLTTIEYFPEALRAYLTQARQETVARLVERVYDAQSGGRPSKWWMAFQVTIAPLPNFGNFSVIAEADSPPIGPEQKRKFMGKSLAV